MKLTIIPADNAVYIDEKCYLDIDLSWIPNIEDKKVHAIQWLDEDDDGIGEGEIEFVGPAQNLKITSLVLEGVCSFEKAIGQWKAKKQEEDELFKKYLEEQERLKKEEEELRQVQFLETHIPASNNEEDEDEDLFYDIEELLKEI
jgi:hypothetical protein